MRFFIMFACLLVASHGGFTRCRLEAYCTEDTWTVQDGAGGALPQASATHYDRGGCIMVSYFFVIPLGKMRAKFCISHRSQLSTESYFCWIDQTGFDTVGRQTRLKGLCPGEVVMYQTCSHSTGVHCGWNKSEGQYGSSSLSAGSITAGTYGSCTVLATKQTVVA